MEQMIGTEAAAKKLNVSARRVRVLCEEGRIEGAKRFGAIWMIPKNPVVTKADRVRPSKIKMKKKTAGK